MRKAIHLSVLFLIAVVAAAPTAAPRTTPQDSKRAPGNPHRNVNDPVMVFVWANDLDTICSDDTVHAGDSMMVIARVKYDQGMCRGFILGYAEALSKSEGVCWPIRPPTVEEVVGGVRAKIHGDTIYSSKQVPASISVISSLQELYPCPATP
jgi:hypothetical protein